MAGTADGQTEGQTAPMDTMALKVCESQTQQEFWERTSVQINSQTLSIIWVRQKNVF
jgi:hypothetical protein